MTRRNSWWPWFSERWSDTTGDGDAAAEVFGVFSETLVSLVCVVEGKEGAAARGWKGCGLGFCWGAGGDTLREDEVRCGATAQRVEACAQGGRRQQTEQVEKGGVELQREMVQKQELIS